jgi:hypothetical protein
VDRAAAGSDGANRADEELRAMNDDDLYGPKLTPPPLTAPIVRGTVAALVTVSVAVAGCGMAANPGAPTDSGNPGRMVVDAGITASDAGNPGANPGTAPLDGGSGP